MPGAEEVIEIHLHQLSKQSSYYVCVPYKIMNKPSTSTRAKKKHHGIGSVFGGINSIDSKHMAQICSSLTGLSGLSVCRAVVEEIKGNSPLDYW